MNVNGGIVVETPSGIGLEVFIPANSPVYKYSIGDTIEITYERDGIENTIEVLLENAI